MGDQRTETMPYQSYHAGNDSSERKSVLGSGTAHRPVSTINVWIGLGVLFLALAGFLCAVSSFIILPKCRWGDPECYFSVKECAYDGKACSVTMKRSELQSSPLWPTLYQHCCCFW